MKRNLPPPKVSAPSISKREVSLEQETASRMIASSEAAAAQRVQDKGGSVGPAAAHARSVGLSSFPLPTGKQISSIPRSFQAPAAVTIDHEKLVSEQRVKATLLEEREQQNAVYKKRMAEMDC